MDRGQRAHDLRAVNQRARQPADVALHLVGVRVVGDLLGLGDAQRAVGHVAEDVLRHAEDLGGLGAVDGVEVGVVLEADVPGRRKHRGHALDRRRVGHRAALPLDDAVGAEVELELAAVVGRARRRRACAGRAWRGRSPARC